MVKKNLDRINRIYLILIDKIVIIMSILSIILSSFHHFPFPRFNVVIPSLVALHTIVVALEPRFFLNMRPAKAYIWATCLQFRQKPGFFATLHRLMLCYPCSGEPANRCSAQWRKFRDIHECLRDFSASGYEMTYGPLIIERKLSTLQLHKLYKL